jgi:hypothetical protein
MKSTTKGEQPTFANKAAEYASNRSEVQIVALIKRKTPEAALTIIQDVILDYASRGYWSPIRRIERSFEYGIIHIWKIALDEVCGDGTLIKGGYTLELLKQILSCSEIKEETIVSRNLTIEYLLDIVLKVIIPNDHRIPTNKELWLELLPLFYDKTGHHANSILIDFFKNNWRRIDQDRIIDLIDGIVEYVKTKSCTVSAGTFEAHLIRHLWRTFNLQDFVTPSTQIIFAQILKPVILFVRENQLLGLPDEPMNLSQIHNRAINAVRETVRQAQLIVDLESEIENQIIKPGSFIKFSRFEINNEGDLKKIYFCFLIDKKTEKVPEKRVYIKLFRDTVSSIESWSKDKGLELKRVVAIVDGFSNTSGKEPFSIETTF